MLRAASHPTGLSNGVGVSVRRVEFGTCFLCTSRAALGRPTPPLMATLPLRHGTCVGLSQRSWESVCWLPCESVEQGAHVVLSTLDRGMRDR